MITLGIDTLALDSDRVSHWNRLYDYNSELQSSDTGASVSDMLSNWLYRLLENLLNLDFDFDIKISNFVCICIVIAIIAGLIFFFIYKKHGIFGRSKKGKILYDVEEETIYGVDFNKDIKTALSREAFREAVRLVYLQTLKYLSDDNKIDWQIFKTPTQYTYEVKTPEFKTLTKIFLCVRYGGFDATHDTYDQMVDLQLKIKKGVNSER